MSQSQRPGPVTRSIEVEELYLQKRETLGLEILNEEVSLKQPITDPDVSGPGLALAGFLERFKAERVQVFGQSEMMYLETLDAAVGRDRLEAMFSREVPAAMVSKGLDVPSYMVEAATESEVPLFRTAETTSVVFRRVKSYLERALAPSTTLHASLADVYGVGLLLQGPSGIGKSECVLDLVERGHRLVADDMVIATREGEGLLMGRGHELQAHHMEIRGVGIVDIQAQFGIRAIRHQKRIEVIIQLVHWDDTAHYDRTGLENDQAEVLGIRVPRVTVPLNPGKNITVICEVAAMNHLLRYAGIDSARLFNKKLKDAMRPVREYLEEDYE
jgi:HPr kinase/phosphorylase